MKRFNSLFVVMVLSALSLGIHAQKKTGADYFASK